MTLLGLELDTDRLTITLPGNYDTCIPPFVCFSTAVNAGNGTYSMTVCVSLYACAISAMYPMVA